jgi:hypothetical protein
MLSLTVGSLSQPLSQKTFGGAHVQKQQVQATANTARGVHTPRGFDNYWNERETNI